MEGGGRQSRLLGRLLGKLRGDHHRDSLENRRSAMSATKRESTNSNTTPNKEEHIDADDTLVATDTHDIGADDNLVPTNPQDIGADDTFVPTNTQDIGADDTRVPADVQDILNVDLRYGGQYLTPEQLPEFCDQIDNLVKLINNIESYGKVIGEYPSEMERRLHREACEVAVLAAEARNALNVVRRTQLQRSAVRDQRKDILEQFATLKETLVRELENTVRLSDRRLFRSWESVKDSTDPAAFEPLLQDIKNKKRALNCLRRLIEGRLAVLAPNMAVPTPTPLPPPMPRDSTNDGGASAACGSRRHEFRRGNSNRRRRDPATRELHSEPLSVEANQNIPQVTLHIQGTEPTSRCRVVSAGAVTLTPLAPLEVPSRGSVRDIIFFTSN